MVRQLSNGMLIGGSTDRRDQLSAMFQIWAESVAGLTTDEALACFNDGDEERTLRHFPTIEEAKALAASGFAKLKGKDIPYFSK